MKIHETSSKSVHVERSRWAAGNWFAGKTAVSRHTCPYV